MSVRTYSTPSPSTTSPFIPTAIPYPCPDFLHPDRVLFRPRIHPAGDPHATRSRRPRQRGYRCSMPHPRLTDILYRRGGLMDAATAARRSWPHFLLPTPSFHPGGGAPAIDARSFGRGGRRVPDTVPDQSANGTVTPVESDRGSDFRRPTLSGPTLSGVTRTGPRTPGPAADAVAGSPPPAS